jgi:hypothetical protein
MIAPASVRRNQIPGKKNQWEMPTRIVCKPDSRLVGADDDGLVLISWTKLFLEDQGYSVKENILHQDNKSIILLQENGPSEN